VRPAINNIQLQNSSELKGILQKTITFGFPALGLQINIKGCPKRGRNVLKNHSNIFTFRQVDKFALICSEKT
jgi:hypothetical protein